MPSLTLTNLRQGLVLSGLGNFEEFATTTNLTTSAVVVSTALRNLGYTIDDMVQERWPWLYIRGTNNSQVDREPDDYTGSSGTITVRGENLAADSGAVTCELLPFRGGRLNEALSAARRDVVDRLHLRREYDTVSSGTGFQRLVLPSDLFIGAPTRVLIGDLPPPTMADNLVNEEADNGFTSVSNWTATQTTTWAVKDTLDADLANDYLVLPPSFSSGYWVSNGGSSSAAILHTVTTNIGVQDIRGSQISFFIWVYCRVGSRIAARIEDGTTSTSGASHLGNGWELLRVTQVVDEASPTLKVGVIDSTNTSSLISYVANAICIAGPLERAEGLLGQLANWRSIEPSKLDTDGYIEFGGSVGSGRWLKIRGKGYLSDVTTESTTMEIDEADAELLYAYARRRIWEQEMGVWDNETKEYRKAIDGLNKARGDIVDELFKLARRRGSSPVHPGMLAWI